ncbi:MAG: toll/interleukin-1 receptor domain-containing protein [Bauldia sp.]|nr:toll/interleukin-1 receptor domain-containing protein [Bauldia sp.]
MTRLNNRRTVSKLPPTAPKIGDDMAPTDKADTLSDEPALVSTSTQPLVFISHDTRDADLAEAFGKLLKSVSAGMIKTFRSSDKKAGDGIDFGDEWYKRLMNQLQSTSDVVCLFTERSVDRPWILFEAGVAKGKLSAPVIGVALGIPLSRVSAGPFYQFMNMDDSEADLSKLINQLARRVQHWNLIPMLLRLRSQHSRQQRPKFWTSLKLVRSLHLRKKPRKTQ